MINEKKMGSSLMREIKSLEDIFYFLINRKYISYVYLFLCNCEIEISYNKYFVNFKLIDLIILR